MHKETFCLGFKENTEPDLNSDIKNREFSDPTMNEFKLNPSETMSVINQIKEYKYKKSVEQSLKDMEDTLIRDTLRDKKLASTIGNSPQLGGTSMNSAHSAALKEKILPYGFGASEPSSAKKQSSSEDPYKELLKEVDKSIARKRVVYDYFYLIHF